MTPPPDSPATDGTASAGPGAGAVDSSSPTETWRWLDLGAQGPYENAATMPVLVRKVAEGAGPIAQTSVWGRTHMNVGWFDDVDATLDLDACAAHDVLVVRRQWFGGGTAFYQEGCAAMWGFLLPKSDDDDLDAALTRFQPVLLDALSRIGLGEVTFEGSSDFRWKGRKLGALTAQDLMVCVAVGGFLNLAKPDIDLYLSVARIPDEKFKDKAVKDMHDYVCTAEEVAGHPVRYEDLRDALVAALADAGITLEPSVLSDDEQVGFEKISRKVGSDAAIRRISGDRFRAEAPAGSHVGFGNFKGRKLCRAGVAIGADRTIVAAMMAGDMHVGPPDTMDRVAVALVGAASSDDTDLRARIASVFEGDDVRQAETELGVTTDDLLAAVRAAITDAAAAGAPA